MICNDLSLTTIIIILHREREIKTKQQINNFLLLIARFLLPFSTCIKNVLGNEKFVLNDFSDRIGNVLMLSPEIINVPL